MTIVVETQAREKTASPKQEPPALIAFREAMALHKKGSYAEAEAILKNALAKAPQDVNLWNARGVNLRVMKRMGEAVWSFRQGLSIDPSRPALWSNLGNTLKDLKHAESAIACHQRALELNPNDAGVHHNLGLAFTVANRHVEALAAFDHALALNPKGNTIRWDRSRGHLHLGDYRRGWVDYEARLATGQLPKRNEPGRRWKGERYDGKRLLIVSEQGYGDAIWIARYLKRVKELGSELIMECRPPLIPLIESMKVVDHLVPKGDPLPDADLHIYQCSVPGLYTTSRATIPAEPYLQAEPRRLAKFAPLLERGKGKLRVGIVWSGSTTFGANHDRAVSVRLFLQWFALPGIQLYSLQKGPPEEQMKALPEGTPIIDLAPLMEDFADTAAVISELDLVLMTDSAVAHLTGALGKPIWVLLSYVPHWLWLLDRTDNPWYPSMRLFRQHSWGDWTGVFDQAAAELLKLTERKPLSR
jgi:Tfp pilus assembly protein PilF